MRGSFIVRLWPAQCVLLRVELGELESKINSASQKALDLEAQLFEQLLGEVTLRQDRRDIACLARAAAVLDVASALAQLAVERHYCRPLIDADNRQDFDIHVPGAIL